MSAHPVNGNIQFSAIDPFLPVLNGSPHPFAVHAESEQWRLCLKFGLPS
jgi:hypothetical protein